MENDDQQVAVSEYCQTIKDELDDRGITCKFDDRESYNPGRKFAEHEAAGIPLRLTVGPREMEEGQIEIARRDTFQKSHIDRNGLADHAEETLSTIQSDLFEAARKRTDDNTRTAASYDEFKEIINDDGGFVWAHWDGTA